MAMSKLRPSAKQKQYERACDAARLWAANCPAETLRFAEKHRVAASYGINPEDAFKIMTNACCERGL